MCASRGGTTPRGAAKAIRAARSVSLYARRRRIAGPPEAQSYWAESERARWDPKDGELCLRRSKPGETLVEDRSDSDVQIDRLTRV